MTYIPLPVSLFQSACNGDGFAPSCNAFDRTTTNHVIVALTAGFGYVYGK